MRLQTSIARTTLSCNFSYLRICVAEAFHDIFDALLKCSTISFRKCSCQASTLWLAVLSGWIVGRFLLEFEWNCKRCKPRHVYCIFLFHVLMVSNVKNSICRGCGLVPSREIPKKGCRCCKRSAMHYLTRTTLGLACGSAWLNLWGCSGQIKELTTWPERLHSSFSPKASPTRDWHKITHRL